MEGLMANDKDAIIHGLLTQNRALTRENAQQKGVIAVLERERDEHAQQFPNGCIDRSAAEATVCPGTGRKDHAVHGVDCFSDNV
jgi:hypothetical protein